MLPMTSVPIINVSAERAGCAYWGDAWRRRHLLWVLASRDIAVRYRQAVVGVGWALLRPLLAMIVFTWIFGSVVKIPAGGMPYALLALTGLLPWQLFSTVVSECTSSLLRSPALVSKVYFPRILLAASPVGAALLDFMVGAALLALLAAGWYQLPLSWYLLAAPVWVVLAVLAALGPGLAFAALSVKYRDFRFVVPFALQLGLYASPVVFRSDMVPTEYRALLFLNPMTGVIDGVRWSLFGPATAPLWVPGLLISGAVIALSMLAGLLIFRRLESELADVI